MNYGSNVSDWREIIFLVIFVGGYLGLRWWRRRDAASVIVESPLLLSMFVNGMKLEKLSEGSLNGYKYSLMITSPLATTDQPGLRQYQGYINPGAEAAAQIAQQIMSDVNPGKTILLLRLPTKSPVHIAALGIPDAKTHTKIDTTAAQNGLISAGLEGDFPDYFSLYCGKSDQVEVRQVLDPTNMAFLVDYCKREDWELFGDTLYFAQNNAFQKDDDPLIENTTMVKDAEQFVSEILPILLMMNKTSASDVATP